MKLPEAVALKLIDEIKKPGRECLYDMNNRFFKNNHKKQNVWAEVADAVGINRNECQAHWKSLRRRYQAVIHKTYGRSDCKHIEIKGFSKLLVAEMDYFRNFMEGKRATVKNFSSPKTETFQSVIDEITCDPDVNQSPVDFSVLSSGNCSSNSTPVLRKCLCSKKRAKLNETKEEYRESIKTLNNWTEALIKASTSKRDPFFLSLEDEFAKVPENKKSILKVKLMSLVVENHQ